MEPEQRRDFHDCCNIYGPFSEANSEIQNKVCALTQICRAVSVVVLLENRKPNGLPPRSGFSPPGQTTAKMFSGRIPTRCGFVFLHN